uniref:Uncharacterized protein n=1 Tax=Paramormyrops kingsleyae TaxID=1676925 RepID=A0A3B3RS31_9TELE
MDVSVAVKEDPDSFRLSGETPAVSIATVEFKGGHLSRHNKRRRPQSQRVRAGMTPGSQTRPAPFPPAAVCCCPLLSLICVFLKPQCRHFRPKH